MIQYDLHGIKMNWVLELTGILLILVEGIESIGGSTARLRKDLTGDLETGCAGKCVLSR